MTKHKLTPEEKKTIDYYDKYAEEWAQKHSHKGKGKFDQDMKNLFKLLPTGKVLEIGVGAGEDAEELIEHYGNDNYVGLEPADGLRKIAIQLNPGSDIRGLTFYKMPFEIDEFDGFWICATLIHVPKNKLSEVLQNINKVIRNEGVGFISVMEGDADHEESRPNRHYSLWSQKVFEKELKDNHFELISKRKIETKGSPWLAYIVKVNKA